MFKKEAVLNAIFILGIPVLGVVAAFVVPRLMNAPCENEVLGEMYSPDRARKAIVFSRNCGATTGFNTQVSLLEANDQLENDAGNTFIADAGSGGAAPIRGGEQVRLRWIGDTKLRIAYPESAAVFKQEAHVEGTELEYAPFK